MPDSKSSKDALAEQSKAASTALDEQAKAAERQAERANEAAERAPSLDTDLEEVTKDASDPTSQRAPADVHARTNDYAAALNVGKPDKLAEAQAALEEEGYSVDPIETGDSPSLPVDVAQAEKDRSAAERKKVATQRRDFAVVTGRRPPERVRTASKEGTGKDPKAIYADNS